MTKLTPEILAELSERLYEEKHDELCASVDKQLKELRIRAAALCIQVYHRCGEAEVRQMPLPVIHVWSLGREISTCLAAQNYLWSSKRPKPEVADTEEV